MNFSINTAFDRIKWQMFTNKGAPNKADIAAMKFIAEWINAQQEQTIASHQMLAKMYVERLDLEFWKLGDFQLALSVVKGIQRFPFSHYVDTFALGFNVMKYREYCEKNNIPWEIPDQISDEDKKLIEWQLQNDPKYKKHVLGYWPTEKVKQSLVNDITDLVNKFKNAD